MSDLFQYDLTLEQPTTNFRTMINELKPIFVEAPPRIWVESTSQEFDLSEDAWAAFDHLCEIYNIHNTPRKKFARSA